MSGKVLVAMVCGLILSSTAALGASDSMVLSGGDLRISDQGSGLVFPDGTVQTTAAAGSGSITGSTQVSQISLAAGETKDVATLSMTLIGGKNVLVLPIISGISWPPAPSDYSGKNHTLHVSITWNVLAGDKRSLLASIIQTGDQNIIQLQAAGGPTTAGTHSVVLQATNNSYWSLDDAPYGTSTTATNNFSVTLSAIEL